MQITVKGQVTIPNVFRIKYGLLPHTRVSFKEIEGHLCLVKLNKKASKHERGESIIKRMRKAKMNNLTTDEIMALTRQYDKKNNKNL